MTAAPDLCWLPARRIYRVSGPDKAEFLDRVISQNVRSLAPGHEPLRFALLLTPQGKIVSDLFLAAPAADFVVPTEAGDWLLDLPADRAERVIETLIRYRLRAHTEFTPLPEIRAAALRANPPAGVFAAPDPRPQMGIRAYGAAPVEPGPAAEPDDYRRARFAARCPDCQYDSAPDRDFALDLDFDALNAIDFKKGCFVGQEVTSRMKRKAEIRTRTRLIGWSEGPPPAPDLMIRADGLGLGEIRSTLGARGLAVVRLDRWAQAVESGLTPSLPDGRPAYLIEPPSSEA